METGTLKELNVKPGDVVEQIGLAGEIVVQECPPRFGKLYEDHWQVGSGLYLEEQFRIISRVAQPTPDLTAITTPFGLLDTSTQEALRAHGGPMQCYGSTGSWFDIEAVSWSPSSVYRVKPGPIIETETMKITNADGMHMVYATVTTYNGTPNWATLQVKLND